MRIRERCMTAGAAILFTAAPLAAQDDLFRCDPNLSPPPDASPVTAAEICATIVTLADDSMQGRRAGTEAADRAAGWIAGRFAAIGLEPLGDGGEYLLPFSFPETLLRDPHAGADPHAAADPHAPNPHALDPRAGGTLRSSANIAGLLRGTDPALADEVIVVGAHYDHLGLGGRGSLATGGEPAIHNGADDNASGVAGVIELAEWFAAHPQPRSLVFAAFGAEELGNIGSGAWVEDPPWPLDRTIAMLNLDMVGRLRETLDVQGTGTSVAWTALLDSLAADPAAPAIARVPDGFGPSDHASFYGQRIPVLAFFTGAHDDYHRPSDDPETIDPVGEVRVLELVAGVIRAAADGRGIPYAEAPVTERRAMAFKVGLGVIPDYGYADVGLRLASVRPDGPAAAGGLQSGDVIVELDGRKVADVYAYTEILAGLDADVPIEAVVRRGEEMLTVSVTPATR